MTDLFTAGNHKFPLNRTYLFGILNTTADSFSDGGKFLSPDNAALHGKALLDEGADFIDIGGESTRPGYQPVSAAEELARVLPAVEALAPLCPVSVDTMKYEVAAECLDRGACIINDIWGLQREPRFAALAAQKQAGLVLMHNQDGTVYQDILKDMEAFFEKSIDCALSAGVAPSSILLDPGIGFGKTREQNLFVLKHLSRFLLLGYPIFLGVSRKSVIGLTLNLPVDQRLEATLALGCLGIASGARFLRVHDVRAHKRAALMCDAVSDAK